MEPTFRVKDGMYLIGSLERGLTVYKQQVRAHNLVWSLWELHRRSELKIDQVAIVGGGIAGLTAAACFLSRFDNVSITLFEQNLDLCPLQQGADHRWLHPRIYDWPTYGSRAPSASLPVLNWSEGRASDVARTILNEFSEFRLASTRSEERLVMYLGLKTFRINAADNKIEWVANKTKPAGAFLPIEGKKGDTKVFDTIILAPGFGLETKVPGFRTESYWRNEQLGQPRLDAKVHKFLISGYGDGALIDLCRLTIERYRQDTILNELFPNDLERTEHDLARERETRTDRDTFHFFESIEEVLAPAQSQLSTRLRKDTTVFLHISGEQGKVKSISEIFGPTSSFQNRMMAFLLLRSGGFTPCYGRLKTAVKRFGIRETNVLCRYGTNRIKHLRSIFVDADHIHPRLMELKKIQGQRPALFWEPGTFPQYPVKGQARNGKSILKPGAGASS